MGKERGEKGIRYSCDILRSSKLFLVRILELSEFFMYSANVIVL